MKLFLHFCRACKKNCFLLFVVFNSKYYKAVLAIATFSCGRNFLLNRKRINSVTEDSQPRGCGLLLHTEWKVSKASCDIENRNKGDQMGTSKIFHFCNEI